MCETLEDVQVTDDLFSVRRTFYMKFKMIGRLLIVTSATEEG